MSDFLKDLDAKAYALVAGSIDLDEFSSWYRLASAARVRPVAVETKQAGAVPISVRTTPADERQDDYAPSEPRLDSMDGPDEDWMVGTGDRDRKRERGVL